MLLHVLQQLVDALCAERQVPFVGDVMPVAGRDDPVVRGDDLCGRRVERPRQLVERDEARPVITRIPAGGGGEAVQIVSRFADRNLRRRDEADVAVDIGIRQVLLRHAQASSGIDEFTPVACPRQL